MMSQDPFQPYVFYVSMKSSNFYGKKESRKQYFYWTNSQKPSLHFTPINQDLG